MQEFRRHTRLKVLIPCGMRLAQSNPSDAWGHIHDISVGGIELHTYFPISKGQTMFLTFSIEEIFSFVNAKCTVVRVREEDGYVYAGVSFDDVVDKNHLKEAMQSLLDRA